MHRSAALDKSLVKKHNPVFPREKNKQAADEEEVEQGFCKVFQGGLAGTNHREGSADSADRVQKQKDKSAGRFGGQAGQWSAVTDSAGRFRGRNTGVTQALCKQDGNVGFTAAGKPDEFDDHGVSIHERGRMGRIKILGKD